MKKSMFMVFSLLLSLFFPSSIFAGKKLQISGSALKGGWQQKESENTSTAGKKEDGVATSSGWQTKDNSQSPSGWVKRVPKVTPVEKTDEAVESSETSETSETSESSETSEIDNPDGNDEQESSGGDQGWDLPNPGDWEPFVDMDAQFFPSFLISTAIVDLGKADATEEFKVGDTNGFVGIALHNPGKNSKVLLEIKENQIMNATRFEAVLEKENEIYLLYPTISYKYDRLTRQKQPLPVSLDYSLKIDNEDATFKQKTAVIRSVNDCPSFFQSLIDNSEADISFMFAAYVNESHPMIDKILKEALKTGIVKGFDGYQSESHEAVLDQVYAIWTALQKRGIKYSSITTPSAHSDNVVSQNVRFIEESLNNTQANCVDGSVLLASILYKIDITPFLVIVPGHMYLGFNLDEAGENFCCLETTMLAEGKGREFFDKVIAETLADFESNRKKFLADDDPDYQIINIKDAREIGILTIGSSSRPERKNK